MPKCLNVIFKLGFERYGGGIVLVGRGIAGGEVYVSRHWEVIHSDSETIIRHASGTIIHIAFEFETIIQSASETGCSALISGKGLVCMHAFLICLTIYDL